MKKVILPIIAIALLIPIVYVLIASGVEQKSNYNDGVCIECGNSYEIHERCERGEHTIVYECPHCHIKGNIPNN